jgi:hypothetical protein
MTGRTQLRFCTFWKRLRFKCHIKIKRIEQWLLTMTDKTQVDIWWWESGLLAIGQVMMTWGKENSYGNKVLMMCDNYTRVDQ